MRLELVPALAEHVEPIAAAMRAADVLEVTAGGETPRGALEGGLEVSTLAETLLVDGRPVAMWGIAPDPDGPFGDDAGVIWMLGTVELERMPLALCRLARAVLAKHGPGYPALRAAMDARYTAALRWARWLGFAVGPAVPAGIGGEPFHGIVWRNHV